MKIQNKTFTGTAKEVGWADAIYVKMDAVNLQGVWPTYPEEESVTGHGANKVGAFIYYLLDEERKRRRRMTGEEVMEHAKLNKLQSLDETIKRFEIQESTDFALLFAEA